MFFPEKITSIKTTDKVLEIGPGANPYHRSDVLLEMAFEDALEYEKQFGHAEKLMTNKPIFFYNGEMFPFKDNEFDYIICSHVIEHVKNIPLFLTEIFRVAKQGYIEYPLIYYEYLYNFDVHINFVKYNNGCLNYLIKEKTSLNEFRAVQDFYYETLQKGHVNIINELMPLMMEGFEWNGPFEFREVTTVSEVSHKTFVIPESLLQKQASKKEETVLELLKKLIKKIVKK